VGEAGERDEQDPSHHNHDQYLKERSHQQRCFHTEHGEFVAVSNLSKNSALKGLSSEISAAKSVSIDRSR
jgi:hypothetical protein